MIKVRDVIALIDYPDDVQVIIYDFGKMDTIFRGLGEDILSYYLDDEVKGLEFPSKNELMININHE